MDLRDEFAPLFAGSTQEVKQDWKYKLWDFNAVPEICGSFLGTGATLGTAEKSISTWIIQDETDPACRWLVPAWTATLQADKNSFFQGFQNEQPGNDEFIYMLRHIGQTENNQHDIVIWKKRIIAVS